MVPESGLRDQSGMVALMGRLPVRRTQAVMSASGLALVSEFLMGEQAEFPPGFPTERKLAAWLKERDLSME